MRTSGSRDISRPRTCSGSSSHAQRRPDAATNAGISEVAHKCAHSESASPVSIGRIAVRSNPVLPTGRLVRDVNRWLPRSAATTPIALVPGSPKPKAVRPRAISRVTPRPSWPRPHASRHWAPAATRCAVVGGAGGAVAVAPLAADSSLPVADSSLDLPDSSLPAPDSSLSVIRGVAGSFLLRRTCRARREDRITHTTPHHTASCRCSKNHPAKLLPIRRRGLSGLPSPACWRPVSPNTRFAPPPPPTRPSTPAARSVPVIPCS